MPDPWTFRLAARLAQADHRLRAGNTGSRRPPRPFDIVSRLMRGDVFMRPVTFPEGLTIHEMAPIFERGGLRRRRRLEQAAGDGTLAAAFDPDAETLEGYLFPTRMRCPAGGAADMVRAMLAQFGVPSIRRFVRRRPTNG